MKNTTITLFVNPECMLRFFEIIKMIDDLPLEHNYKWQVKDIAFSHAMISNFLWINIPIELYIKFMYSYKFNGGIYN